MEAQLFLYMLYAFFYAKKIGLVVWGFFILSNLQCVFIALLSLTLGSIFFSADHVLSALVIAVCS